MNKKEYMKKWYLKNRKRLLLAATMSPQQIDKKCHLDCQRVFMGVDSQFDEGAIL